MAVWSPVVDDDNKHPTLTFKTTFLDLNGEFDSSDEEVIDHVTRGWKDSYFCIQDVQITERFKKGQELPNDIYNRYNSAYLENNPVYRVIITVYLGREKIFTLKSSQRYYCNIGFEIEGMSSENVCVKDHYSINEMRGSKLVAVFSFK